MIKMRQRNTGCHQAKHLSSSLKMDCSIFLGGNLDRVHNEVAAEKLLDWVTKVAMEDNVEHLSGQAPRRPNLPGSQLLRQQVQAGQESHQRPGDN